MRLFLEVGTWPIASAKALFNIDDLRHFADIVLAVSDAVFCHPSPTPQPVNGGGRRKEQQIADKGEGGYEGNSPHQGLISESA